MKPISKDLYNKIVDITNDLREKFRKRGIVIPTNNDDGSISLGYYSVTKNYSGFYQILDYRGIVITDQINLPQTAIMLANNLALGKFLDQSLLQKDKNYGYALFDEQVHKRSSVRKSLDVAEIMLTKSLIAKSKKEYYKNDIIRSFEKLRKLV